MSLDMILRQRVASCVTAAVLLVAGAGRAGAGDRFTFRYDPEKLAFGTLGGYDIIRYENLDLSTEIGAPQVPVELVRIALPPGAEIAAVRIVKMESEDLAGEFDLFPVQKPQILSQPAMDFAGADPQVYASPSVYPGDVVDGLRRGFQSDFNTAALAVHPVQYQPARKRIIFHSLIEIEVDYKPGAERPLRHRSSEYSDRVHRASLERTVRNPERLERSPRVETPGPPPARTSATVLPAEEHLYVVITSASMVQSFGILVDRKTMHGLSATTVTTDWIADNYEGVDLQEQIRNFIKDAYENWGTVWVLLGGDTNVIPARMTYAMDCEMGGANNQIPCDLYYADLDGDWNANGNAIYGEVTDDVDMYPDVFVGRAPFGDEYEASGWVMKLMDYEIPLPENHALDMLFLADVLWQNPYTNSGDAKDYIDQAYVPDRFDPVEKLYAALGNENYVNAMAALNRGVNIINHCGHAWWSSMQIGSGWLLPADMYDLTNDHRCSILFSIGCWPAAFDYDCIAEAFLTNPGGGGVAFIGNSRYGWGSPGNPLYGYSDRFDQQFFRMLFDENIVHIGQALAEAKSVYVPFARQENVYRWCEYEVNLLGDPAMPVWTDEPQWMHVEHPYVLPVGPVSFPITVTRDADGSPVEGALVCLAKGDEVYETGFTGHDGRVVFAITTVNPAEEMWIGVTAPNLREGAGSVNFTTDRPCVQITRYAANGSVYGLVAPGDSVSMDVCFKNLGTKPAEAVTARISETGAHITLLDSTEAIGSIPPGDSVYVAGAYRLAADSSLTNGEIVHLLSEITAGAYIWKDRISVTG
ncbi:MAG: C25 family cysteine peptidase, partial [bacterium]